VSGDTLSEILSAVRLKGAVFFDVEASAPWVAEAPPSRLIAPVLMAHAEHVMEYHVITKGSCWAQVVGHDLPPVELQAGDVIAFPQGDPHILSSKPGMRGDTFGKPEFEYRDGLPIRGQVAGRPVALLYGLELSFSPFSTCPSYAAVADLPLEQRLSRLRDPAMRAKLLAEEPTYRNPQMLAFMRSVGNMYVLGDPPNYTPPGDQRLDARAARLGVTPLELAYDLLVSGDGRTILFHPGANYTDASDANMASMLRHDHTVMALGDGGAHYGMICDASYTTHALTYWTRDRPGERWSLPWAVQQLTDVPARMIGLGDRGRLAPGYKADLNVIDLDNLRVAAPHPEHNLPGGGRRLEQKAEGYRATVVGGEITYRDGEFTGALPGRLVRGARSV